MEHFPNATLVAQIFHIIILILFVAGILVLIFKAWFFKKSTINKIDEMEKELKEIRKIIEDKRARKAE
ncbi:hypothetical protein L9W92_12805 [Pelotomaculum terephthalicicum JT]|uniref:hypothetical protein n=1 Tax=Pelotomaculum TaxID=191373 RepID=UPI0009CEBBF8|nr:MULTISPECIES: hypothetical protein [Pelotomaculum]MCG9968914.1 hypothetical protein [Pelotomaculum terephthalicicum JT]OPX91973.1 MAG: hypothetical protein A4E54_00106 [Pelotomaculum sp. PtaB.Bin117]OPY60952.1 MAG: hypothetical protein A4E56_02377 [Pelotomaculum sp. PtaU1.Bin065]